MALQRWLPHLGTEWTPFAETQDLQQELNRLFNIFSQSTDRSEALPEAPWTPSGDVYETKDEIVAVLELPGVREKDLDISVVGDTLTVRGERHREKQPEEERYYRLERTVGPFSRTFVLPSVVDADRIKAVLKDGLLEIRLPKREEAKPRSIPVHTA